MSKPNPDRHSGKLAWLDLEMTGLDPDSDDILEMAIVVTDKSLDIVAESKTWVFGCDEAKLAGMDDWNTKTHTGSGLLEEVRASSLDYATAEKEALDFLREWVDEGCSPMCGNSICQDRRFLYRCMPNLHEFFHYRNFDVSTFKLGSMFWFGKLPKMERKESLHRAMSDIRESISEMRIYCDMLFKG